MFSLKLSISINPTKNKTMTSRISLTMLLLALGIQVVNAASAASSTTANKPVENASTQVAGSKPAATAQSTAVAIPRVFTDAEKDSCLKMMGFLVSQRSGLPSLELTEKEWNLVFEGMKLKSSPVDTQEEWMSCQEWVQQRDREKSTARKQAQTKAAQEYFAKLDKDKDVRKTDSDLYYKIKSAGTGDKPKENDIVTINYTGKLLDGTVFNDTSKSGTPAEFALNDVIPGMNEGLKLIGKGGKIELYVPAKLAYGDQEPPGIPAGSTLVFEVELIDLKPNSSEIDLSKLIDFGPENANPQQNQAATQPAKTPEETKSNSATTTTQPANGANKATN
jgi:FKBP-type peptidyl-prolyl cis-trans isomerase